KELHRLSALLLSEPEPVRGLSITSCRISGACGCLCGVQVSLAVGGADWLDRGGGAVDRLPRRALRCRRAGRAPLRGCGHHRGRSGQPAALASTTGCCAGYACHTLRMIERASLSGSWCEGTLTLTTSAL